MVHIQVLGYENTLQTQVRVTSLLHYVTAPNIAYAVHEMEWSMPRGLHTQYKEDCPVHGVSSNVDGCTKEQEQSWSNCPGVS